MKITAAVAREKGEALLIEELELAPPGDEELIVEIAGTGLCHTDAAARDQAYDGPLPAVFGHEGAGVVIAVGKNTADVAVGDHVVLSYASCGTCPRCARGHLPYCRDFLRLNLGIGRESPSGELRGRGGDIHGSFFGQSSFASHARASRRSAVVVPPEVPIELLGPLGCSVQTGAGAVINSLRPPPGSAIAIFGAGAVGLSALLAARLAGCTPIIAVDPLRARRALARELGATHAIDPHRGDTGDEIRELTRGGVDFAIEAVGIPDVLEQAICATAPTGTCVLLGTAPLGTKFSLKMGVLIAGRTVRGVVEGDAAPQAFIPQLVHLWQSGLLPFDRFVTHYPLAEINRAFDDLRDGSAIKPIVRP